MSDIITIKDLVGKKGIRKITVEINADQLERLAANFGFFNEEFLKSVEHAEADYKAGRITKIASLKDIHKHV